MPNRFQIDPWRQTYSTTDAGPTYRLGENLFLLQPPTPGGKAVQLGETLRQGLPVPPGFAPPARWIRSTSASFS